MTNARVENRAIELVVAYEKKRLSLESEDSILRIPRGQGYDLQSADGRKIEVKGTEGNAVNVGFRLNSTQEITFVEDGGFIYRVVDVFGSAQLYILSGHQLRLYKSQWASVLVPAEFLTAPIQLVEDRV